MRHLSEIELSRSALLANARSLRKITPIGAEFIAVVKGNAYGHGLAEVVEVLSSEVDGFQVDDIEELTELRRHTAKRALVLGYVPKEGIEEAVRLRGELAIYDGERLPALQAAAEKVGLRPKLHLKLDALLGRQGVLPSDIPGFLESLKQYPNLEVVALYGHFANIEDTTDMTHANAQVEIFNSVHSSLLAAGLSNLGRHLSATSGLMVYEPTVVGNSLVRVGIGLYGLYPSLSMARTHARLGLTPVMRWRTHLAQVKLIPAGHPVGYGLTYVSWRPTLIGIVPQGYSDGYDRGLSNAGEVLVHGKRCPIVGRIAMNMFAVDLSQAPQARAEDEVVLLGHQGTDRITTEELAARLGTINYEVTTRVSPLLPRTLA
jgi:alanine racemase